MPGRQGPAAMGFFSAVAKNFVKFPGLLMVSSIHDLNMCIYIYTCIYIYSYIYIHTYIYINIVDNLIIIILRVWHGIEFIEV